MMGSTCYPMFLRSSASALDRISGFPNELLSHILTMLTLKEAIATSILSRRWKKLWVSYPTLDFGCFVGCDPKTFVQRVDYILGQFDGPKLHKFRIVYSISSEYVESHIDDWISIAMRNGVSELELNFNGTQAKPYSVFSRVFGGEEIMNSNHCASLLTTSPSLGKHFESLRDLCLRFVNLSDHVIDMILSSCSSLERLLLMETRGLVNVKNKAPHLKLKSLELYFCRGLEVVQLLVPTLVSFNYQGREIKLCIKDAHQLASLRLSTPSDPNPRTRMIFPSRKNFILSQFSSYLPKLESLILTAHLFEGMIDFTELYVFSNLKHLVLEVYLPSYVRLGYQVAASIIRAAPYLELLEITLPPLNLVRFCEMRPLELFSMSPHHNLKQVKLFGIRGDENTMEFLSYLVEYAVFLRKIYVSASGAGRSGDRLTIHDYIKLKPDEAKKCKQFVLQLGQTLPENVQLLFHEYEQCF